MYIHIRLGTTPSESQSQFNDLLRLKRLRKLVVSDLGFQPHERLMPLELLQNVEKFHSTMLREMDIGRMPYLTPGWEEGVASPSLKALALTT